MKDGVIVEGGRKKYALKLTYEKEIKPLHFAESNHSIVFCNVQGGPLHQL